MILVTGATGNIGYALIKVLVKKGAAVRAVVLKENTTAAGRFQPPGIAQATQFPAGVDVFEGDLAHPETMVEAFVGVTGLFINPRAVGTAVEHVLAVAKERGVRRVVTLSASNVDEDFSRQPSRFNGDRNKEVETAVMNSGMESTALRSATYAINSVGLWAAQIKAGDVVRGPGAAWENAILDERDIAEVAAHALLRDDLVGQRPVLTGPESLSQAEMVTIIGDVIGRQLTYQELPSEVAKQGMLEHGFSEAFVNAYLSLLASDAGKPAPVSDNVEKILGRPAHTFAQWVKEHAADFER